MFALAIDADELLRDPVSEVPVALEELDGAQTLATLLVTRGLAAAVQVVDAPAGQSQVIESDEEVALLVDLLVAERRLAAGAMLN
jgi:hypothetical protein